MLRKGSEGGGSPSRRRVASQLAGHGAAVDIAAAIDTASEARLRPERHPPTVRTSPILSPPSERGRRYWFTDDAVQEGAAGGEAGQRATYKHWRSAAVLGDGDGDSDGAGQGRRWRAASGDDSSGGGGGASNARDSGEEESKKTDEGAGDAVAFDSPRALRGAPAGVGGAGGAAAHRVSPITSPASRTRPLREPTAAERALEDALCHPETLSFLTWRELLGTLPCMGRRWRAVLLSDWHAPAVWAAACSSLSAEAGLWLPKGAHASLGVGAKAWKKLFFEYLFPSRNKWAAPADSAVTQQGFKIQVAVRFRPGERGTSALALPLHQFLKLKREQARKLAGAVGAAPARLTNALGDAPPDEFTDAITGAVMRDPVRFPSSGAVVDRSTAVAHVRARGTDPLNGRPCTVGALVPLEELRSKVAAWREENEGHERHKVGMDAMSSLVEAGGEITPEVMEALLEAERLQGLAARVEAEANSADRRWHGDDVDDGRGVFAPSSAMARQLRHGGDDDWEDGDWDGDALAEFGEAGAGGAGGARGADEGLDSGDGALAAAASPPSATRFRRRGDGPRVLATQRSRVVMYVPGSGVRPFHYGRVHTTRAAQEDVYAESARPAVLSALNGFNACVLCYGQTGSGKTHTMFGPEGTLAKATREFKLGVPLSDAGVVFRACEEVLRAAEDLADAPTPDGVVRLSITAQYVDIYNERVTCLLSGHPVRVVSEDGELRGAEEASVESLDDVARLLEMGEARKTYAATAMNERSSRAHTVFVLQLTQTRGDAMLKSNLHLVDLAGCERVKKSRVVGGRLVEATKINGSLLVLGRCLTALLEERRHVPYLESKLTALLRGAFGGNSRTTAIITAHSDDDHAEETLQALHFGERCGLVTNTARFATSSVSAAMEAVDAAITTVQGQMAGLEARRKSHLPAYKRLRDRLRGLVNKRRELGEAAQ